MVLTSSSVVHYLLAKGYLDRAQVVRGPCQVREISRRNLNLHVSCGAASYLVKQVKTWRGQFTRSIESEAAWYWRAQTQAEFTPLRPLMPACHAWDPAGHVLILEWLTGDTLGDACYAGRFSSEAAALLGSAVGEFHRRFERSDGAGEIPWYLAAHQAGPETLTAQSGGNRELLRIVRKEPGFTESLDELQASWVSSTLVHADLKLDNCLHSPAGIRFLDWELCDYGDPGWDLGTVLQSYLGYWIRRPEERRLELIQECIRAFWNSYAQARRLDGGAAVESLRRSTRFAGARLIQTAWERLQFEQSMVAEGARLIQTSLNVLTRPEQAARELFGVVAA